jgi:hypothetical protein
VSELKQLEDNYRSTHCRMLDVEARRRARENELRVDLNKQLETEYGAQLAAARKAHADAEAALQTEQDRIALATASERLPFPEGTVVEQWLGTGWMNRGTPQPTGKLGRIEVFRKGDVWVGAGYRQPSIGSPVLRHLLKDGKPGRKVDVWSDWMKGQWKVVKT